MGEPTKEPIVALEHLEIPEIVNIEIITTDIGPSIDIALEKASKFAANIVDDPSREIALDAAEKIKDEAIDPLEKWREEFYMAPWYRPSERIREIFDSRLKPARAVFKTIMTHVSEYNVKKERQERLAREKAEAEARRLRLENERLQREAAEAERKAEEAVESEKRRIKEAEEAEARSIQAEKEATERREREGREAAAAETRRKLLEEEDARIREAEVADDLGNGPEKVDTILETATGISPVLAKGERVRDREVLRLEQEQATRVAEEKLLREQAAQAEAEKNRLEAAADAKLKRDAAQAALAAATAAAAAAASTSIVANEKSRTFGVERLIWDLDSDGTEEGDKKAVLAILKAILDTQGKPGEVPIEFMGYDPKSPEKFRPSKIQKSINDLGVRFSCPGIKVYPQRDDRLKRRKVKGRR